MNRNLGRVLHDILILLIILVACVKVIGAYLFDKNNNDINTKLQAAIENCDLEIMKPLVKKGKDSSSIGERALFGAAKEGCLEIVKFLLNREADINAINEALLYAAREGQLEIVKILLENGANPYHEDQYRRTAKMIAKRILFYYSIDHNDKTSYREIIDLLEDAEKRYESKQ